MNTAEELYKKARHLDGERKFDEAAELYLQAAELGHTDAMRYLAELYMQGWGADKSGELAIVWRKKSSELAKDLYKRAFELDLKNAELGDASAAWAVHYCYHSGKGVEQSDKKATEWLIKLVKQGDKTALFPLAIAYEYGEGVRKSLSNAKWLYQQDAKFNGSKEPLEKKFLFVIPIAPFRIKK